MNPAQHNLSSRDKFDSVNSPRALSRRFAIARVCVVADRGLISAETLAELEDRRLLYILGVRERSDKLVRQSSNVVPSRPPCRKLLWAISYLIKSHCRRWV